MMKYLIVHDVDFVYQVVPHIPKQEEMKFILQEVELH